LPKAIVTVIIGERFNQIACLTTPSLMRYAEKIGADFVPITEEKIKAAIPHFEKFQVYELLKRFDRIVYFDIDILINKTCPDIFEIVPKNRFGIFNEGKIQDRSKAIRKVQECKGWIGWEKDYYNSGVMVCSVRHRDIFEPRGFYYDGFLDQTLINYRLHENGTKIFELPSDLNRMDMLGSFGYLKASVIHYAGCGYTGQDVTKEAIFQNKLQRIKRDVKILEGKNESKISNRIEGQNRRQYQIA
jgi:hypothetical protein